MMTNLVVAMDGRIDDNGRIFFIKFGRICTGVEGDEGTRIMVTIRLLNNFEP